MKFRSGLLQEPHNRDEHDRSFEPELDRTGWFGLVLKSIDSVPNS